MIYIVILLSVFLVDLMIKKYVEENIDENEQKVIAGGRITVRKFHNDGIALGKLADHKDEVRKGTFAVMGGSLVYFILLLFKKGRKLKKLGLALFLGGAACNWFDRFHQRTVTDYFSLNVKWKKLKNLVFNISDVCIVLGLLLAMLSRRKR